MKKVILLFTCFLISMGLAFSQNARVNGVVVDENGEPMFGVSVFAKNAPTIGTTTATDGTFQLSVPSSVTALSFKYLGMQDQDVQVNPGQMMKVVMATSATALEEVVVAVAYGESKKIALTGAVGAIGAKDIENRPISSVTAALEGVTGVQVNNTYGQPGTDPIIQIRGYTSVNGSNSPLYVLDGVAFGGNVSDLNPQDIESISVLKDAAASALYGTRAANGVVLITTKKGRSETPTIRINVNQGIYERGAKDYAVMNPDEFMESMFIGYRNNLMSTLPATYPTIESANAKAQSSLISDVLKYNIYNKPNDGLFDANGKLVAGAQILDGYKNDLNWYDPLERKGYRQEYAISGDGKTSKAAYLFSTSYLDEKGYFNNSGYNRFTGRAKVDLSPKKWINTGFSLSGAYELQDWTNGNNDLQYTNPFMFARNMAPIYPVHLHDMATGDYLLDDSDNKQYDSGALNSRPQYLARNVVWENSLDKDKVYRNTLEGQAYADIMFLKDFKFTIKGDLNVRNQDEQTYNNALIGDGAGNNGRTARYDYAYKEYTFQQQLYWNRLFNDHHHIDLLAAHENYAWERNYTYLYKTNQIFANQINLSNFTSITTMNGYTDLYRLESYLFRARYNFDEKYFGEFSFRRDGSSRFAPGHRWGNFWSVGGSWIISKEDFMKPLKDQINYLKLRSSYGELGNDQSVTYYGYMGLYIRNQNANKGAFYLSQNPAPNISWEATTSFGVALEGRLFNKIDFSVEYFDKRSRDLLFAVYNPLSAGATSTSEAVATTTQNLGAVSNKGVEANINVDIFTNRDWKWSVGVNATAYKNKILTLPEQNRENGIINGSKKYMEGHGIYDFWLYQYVGVDQMTGMSLFKPNYENYYIGDPVEGKSAIPAQYVVTINGQNYVTYATYAERNWSGSAIPDVAGSFNTALRYKNFNLNALFTYSLGGKTLNYTYNSLMTMSGAVSQMSKDVLKSWNGVPAGMTEDSPNRIDPNGTPVLDFSKAQYTYSSGSTQALFSSSYFVFKNVNLSYSLPQSLIHKLDISRLSIVGTIENVFTLTALQGMDPQQNLNGLNYNYMATARVFSLGLSAQF